MDYLEFVGKISSAQSVFYFDSQASPTGCRYFDYSARQPNLYLLMKFKQAVVAEFGLERGFWAYRQTVIRHAGAHLSARPLESQLAFAVMHATACTVVAPGGEAFTVEPPRVIGPSNHRSLSGRTRSFYVACVANAHVRGRSEVINTGDRSLIEYQGAELSRIDDEIEYDSAVFHCAENAVYNITPELDANTI